MGYRTQQIPIADCRLMGCQFDGIIVNLPFEGNTLNDTFDSSEIWHWIKHQIVQPAHAGQCSVGEASSKLPVSKVNNGTVQRLALGLVNGECIARHQWQHSTAVVNTTRLPATLDGTYWVNTVCTR